MLSSSVISTSAVGPFEVYVYLCTCFASGDKLRELMAKNGDKFDLVEMDLKKWKEKEHAQTKQGRWVTKHYLMTTEGWTKTGKTNAHSPEPLSLEFPQEDG